MGLIPGTRISWQLRVNTPTTVVELFLGLFTLAAANRVEKRNWELHQKMTTILVHVETTTAEEDQEIAAEELTLADIKRVLARMDRRISALAVPQRGRTDLKKAVGSRKR